MENINILMSVNKRFLENSEEMIFSLLYYSSKKINLYLMYQEKELNEKDIQNLSNFVLNTQKGRLIPIKFDTTKLEGVRVTGEDGYFFSIETYSRLFCAFYLPENVDRILYLDVDMICTGDISELYDISLEGKIWAGAEDRDIEEKDLLRLGLPKDYKYINAGVALINVEKLRKNYSEQDILEPIIKNHREWIYLDQDFVNKIFAGDIKVVSNKYNLLAKSTRYSSLKEKPLIIHYAGSVKPWDQDVSRFDIEYIEPYYEILEIEEKKEKLDQLKKEHRKHGYNNKK